jgi:light-harvesting complex 1 beta chain
MADKDTESLTGLTEEQAQEFNAWMIRGTAVYIAFALVAHTLMWLWKPWFNMSDPGNFGLIESGQALLQMLA